MRELAPLASIIGGGFIAGALVGYAVKKIIKIAVIQCWRLYVGIDARLK